MPDCLAQQSGTIFKSETCEMLHDEAKSITQTFQWHAFSKSGHTSVEDLKVFHPHCASVECLLKHSPTKHLDV